jgi:hypothetical protein
MQPFSFKLMKRLFFLFAFIVVLIISEYFLLREVLSSQRAYIIVLSFSIFLASTFILVRLFRKTQEHTKG